MAGVLRAKDNPVVFFDLHSNKQKIGRDICPKAAQNFRQLCTGQFIVQQRPTGYKDTCLHKIVSDRYIEGGDFITSGNGKPKPKTSIYGPQTYFQDQSFQLKHTQAGLLSLINNGQPNTNGNLFRITCGPCPELDGLSVVFGQVIDQNSLKIIKSLSACGVSADYRPKFPIVIKDCGEM